MNVFVTGGTGFIGSNLIQILSEKHKIFVLSRQIKPELPIKANLNEIEFYEGNIFDRKRLKEIFEKIKIDIIIHLSSSYRSPEYDTISWKTDIESTKNVINLALEYDVKRLIYFSSVDVYGSSKEVLDETAGYRLQNIYSKTKAESEKLITDSKLKYTIIQPATVYGPGDKRLLKIFRMINKKRFFVFGNGNSSIHPVYVKDLINFICHIIDNDKSIDEKVIVGGLRYYTKNEFFNEIAHALDKPSPKIHVPYNLAFLIIMIIEKLLKSKSPVSVRSLDFFKSSRAYSINKLIATDFSPAYSLERGLKETIEWYRENKWI